MLEMLGSRQKDLLVLLLKNKAGLTADDISEQLGISRNAVRQHLAALENDRLLQRGETCATGGRPKQLYVLTDKGRECFPRHYSWFAELLVSSLVERAGAEGLSEQLGVLGRQVGQQLLAQHAHLLSPGVDRAAVLATLMDDLGYVARARSGARGEPFIEADNCVFHALAERHPEVCAFDLALMSTFTGQDIEHQECMARQGQVCRFRLCGGRAPQEGATPTAVIKGPERRQPSSAGR